MPAHAEGFDATHNGHGGTTHDGHHQGDHEHGGLGKYILVFLALCFLTLISFGTAHFMMGPESQGATQVVGRMVMIAVSCCKALLVMLFFMHLIWEANWKYVLTIPASIMSIFLLLMLCPDILGRTRHYAEERWLYASPPRIEESTAAAVEPAKLEKLPSKGSH